MAKITRIKASDSTPKKPKKPERSKSESKKPTAKPTLASEQSPAKAKLEQKAIKKAGRPKSDTTKKPMPKALTIITWPFRTIAKPFIALGRYIKASWHEIRQVRWPSRKATWKMTGAILIYAALIMTIILLLDALFTFIFNNILGS